MEEGKKGRERVRGWAKTEGRKKLLIGRKKMKKIKVKVEWEEGRVLRNSKIHKKIIKN